MDLRKKIIGKVIPYDVKLGSNISLESHIKESKFTVQEWSYDFSNEHFEPGFEPAILVDDILCVEYVEMKKITILDFDIERNIFYQKKCKIFDLIGNRSNGLILVHPNGVSEPDKNLTRYLMRLGYEQEDFNFSEMKFEKNTLLEIFISDEIIRRGIRIVEKDNTEIDFWTGTELNNDKYYKKCKELGIENENIDRIRIRIKDHDTNSISPEIIIYQDYLVCGFTYYTSESWKFIKELMRMLGVYEGGGD